MAQGISDRGWVADIIVAKSCRSARDSGGDFPELGVVNIRRDNPGRSGRGVNAIGRVDVGRSVCPVGRRVRIGHRLAEWICYG